MWVREKRELPHYFRHHSTLLGKSQQVPLTGEICLHFRGLEGLKQASHLGVPAGRGVSRLRLGAIHRTEGRVAVD
jgi:hypothetical protein